MNKVSDFLKENVVMSLATCSSDKPRASAMEYYMVGDSIIFATSPDSIKAGNLKVNTKISMSVHNMPKFVTIDGSVTEPTQAEIDSYNQQLFTNHPEFKQMAESGMMKPFIYFKVIVDTFYFNDYSAGMKPTEIIKA